MLHTASSLLARLRRPLALFVFALGALGFLAATPRAHALTAASLTAAALTGKTLQFTITGGNAPFETSGGFSLVFGTNGTYTMPIADGNLAMRSGTFTVSVDSFGTVIKLDGYIVNNATVELLIIPTGNDLRSQFEMYAGPANKRGVVVFSTGGTGGTGGAPVITSATAVTATVGQPFTYQVTANPAATTYTNTGGNAPLSLPPSTGLASGTFTTAGTFTFSFTASNAAGSSPVTTVTVTVTAGSTGGGGSGTVTNDDLLPANLVGRTLAFTITSPTNTLEDGPNAYSVTLTSALLLQRTAPGWGWNPTTYTATTALGDGALRLTTLRTSGSWSNSSLGYAVNITLSQSNGIGRFTVTDVNSSTRANSGTFTLSGTTTGIAPVITSATTGTANVGSAYSYQIVASNLPTSYSTTGLPAGLTLNTTTGLISGTPTTAGTATITLTATNSTGSATTRLTLTVAAPVVNTIATAPTNLVGYRNKVGQAFQFTVTGSPSGAVWGTEVYTDDSTIARAAVHAGVLAVGETRTVTITILPGQPSYPASSRNGVSSSSWGAWSGSYSFAGAGAVISTANVATTRPTVAPGFTAGSASLATGGRLICPINVTGGGTYTYQWYLNNVLLVGATANPYIVESITAANAGTYTVDVTNNLGTARLTAGTIAVGTSGSPVLALQPISKTVVPGATFTLAANASGTANTYQWLRNNVALAGETGAILLRNNAAAADSGSYAVRVTNPSGTVTSNAATITLSETASRPANISVRTNVATGTLVTPGFVVQGSGTKRVLIRAVGPGLAAFGLAGTMADPKFTVFQGSTQIATNDDWTAANASAAFTATGAFALPPGSKDAALVTDLAAGRDYTVQVTNATGTGGLVLIEVYDADALKGTSTSKLVNVSVRGQTAPGDDVLTLGLVIGGQGPRTLLVRGVGPKLASFGVTGTVPDPRLQIVDSQGRVILANDDWAGADFIGELVLASQYVGAFALDNGSKDAATLSLVEPGAYTIQVSGTAAAPTGEALVEVYEVP